MRRKKIAALIVVLFLLGTSTSGMSISPVFIGAWATVTPLIDGEISPEEYDDAYTLDFDLEYGEEVISFTLYVKNDHTNLYIGLEVRDQDYSSLDMLRFYFDNNDDGTPEVGDDVLTITGHVFSDMHIFDSANILATNDPSHDGVGAAHFKWALGLGSKWVFELAHPLDSADSSHDFSLSLGDTVGFCLVYWDYNAMEGGGWPTPTPNWSEMVHIRIEAPILPPLNLGLDITIAGIEVTQAVQHLDNSMPLVRNKETIARVYVDIGSFPWWWPTHTLPVTVQLYGLDGDTRQTLQSLTETIMAREDPERGHASHTANFLLPSDWTYRRSVVFKAYAKGPDTRSESNYDNNWMLVGGWPELTLPFGETRTLNVHVVPINTAQPGATPVVPSPQEIEEQEEYMRAIYPIARINFIHHDWQLVGAVWTGFKDDLIADLNVVAGNLGIAPPDQIFGLLPGTTGGGGVSNPTWPWVGGLGVAACGSKGGSTSQEGLMAHELIHNLGPLLEWDGTTRGWCLHTWDDDDWPYGNNNINEYGASATWGWPPLIIPANTPDIMSYDQSGAFPTKWISPYRWENMFNFFSPVVIPPPIRIDAFQISGLIGTDGKGALDPVFRLSASPLQPGGSSACGLELQDAAGNILLAKGFEPVFVNHEGEVQDPYHFAMFLPYQEGVARVVFRYNGDVVDTVQKSQNKPTVTVLSPNGGEHWSGLHTIEWAGNDADGDALTCMVQYSRDGGTSWEPLIIETTETSCTVDFARIPGSSEALVRVVATDGLNTAQDESDEVFTVELKAPQATIVRPSDDSVFSADDTVSLRGNAYDVEDGQLPEDAFSWSSDKDGSLGTGSSVDISGLSLSLGTHTITLTVRDSHGMENTDTVTIRITQPSKGAVQILDDLEVEIFELDSKCFKPPAGDRRSVLIEKIEEVILKIINENYHDAEMKLLKDVRAKMDSTAGGRRIDDWIIEESAQEDLLPKIDAVLETLGSLVG